MKKPFAVVEDFASTAIDRAVRERTGRLLSAPAASRYTGWPYSTLMRAAKNGDLPVVRFPGSNRVFFDRKDLDRAIEAWKERLG